MIIYETILDVVFVILEMKDDDADQEFEGSEFPGSYQFGLAYFRDCQRRIDFVLAYIDSEDTMDERIIFERNLKTAGLQLEVEKSVSKMEDFYFIKIHIPDDILNLNAKILDMKYVFQRRYAIEDRPFWLVVLDSIKNRINPPTIDYRTSIQGTFVTEEDNGDLNFSETDRIAIVWDILRRTRYGSRQEDSGIRKLLKNGVYTAAYPLHGGDYLEDPPEGTESLRRELYVHWANIRTAFSKRQPLELVKNYFGEEVGLYFVWLGYYTEMLSYAAIVGVIVFMYGLLSWKSEDMVPTGEICKSDILLCPVCREEMVCKYVELNNSCLFSKLTYSFDNPSIVFFAAFMSIWAAVFMGMWGRKEAILSWRWDLVSVEYEDEPRPQFERNAKHERLNTITGKPEFYVPLKEKILRYIAATVIITLMTCFVIVSYYGLLHLRIEISLNMLNSPSYLVREYHGIVGGSISAVLCVIVMLIFHYTFKIYVFQFINYYANLLYTIFFKGMFYGHPGNTEERYSLASDLCDPSGCIFEIFIQLVVIMLCKQAFFLFLQYMQPKLDYYWSKFRTGTLGKSDFPRWEADYYLSEFTNTTLFKEQLDMVIQYGFVTLFVAAFPLAPLLALINNVLELRVDAAKLLIDTRRSIPRKVRGMGAWGGILHGITFLAIFINALMIAFRSDFVPRFMYKLNHDGKLKGYVNSSFSVFDIRDLPSATKRTPNGTCRYKGYREPYTSEHKYRFRGHRYLLLATWEIDYDLQDYNGRHLFKERLEMVIQYGFVTLFAVVFPLAPVLAFIHNILELRLHAFRILVQSRRTIPRKIRGTGIWGKILQSLTYLAIISNAFLIAVTSDFIPRLVYKVKHNGDLTGYIHDFYLSEFNTSDYGVGPLPFKTCRYIGFRLPPNSPRKYQLSTDYWHTLTARLIFIVVFEHVILIIVGILAYFIPNVPNSVKQRMALERADTLRTREEIVYTAK
ncbi:hypothetical protein L9F63_006290, partial [Diploptera punctata]